MAYPGGVRLAQVILSVFSSPHRQSVFTMAYPASTGDSLSVLMVYGAWHIPEE